MIDFDQILDFLLITSNQPKLHVIKEYLNDFYESLLVITLFLTFTILPENLQYF
jgi:hypothetical protein